MTIIEVIYPELSNNLSFEKNILKDLAYYLKFMWETYSYVGPCCISFKE